MRVTTMVVGLVLAACSAAMAAPAYTVTHNGSLMLVTPVARNEIVIQYATLDLASLGWCSRGPCLCVATGKTTYSMALPLCFRGGAVPSLT